MSGVLTETYLRRYLNDPTVPGSFGTPVTLSSGIETDDTKYFRRYLNDFVEVLEVNFISPLETPNGIITEFTVASLPKFCTFNGLVQHESVGYIVTITSGVITIHFIDVNGATIIPEIGDTIRAEIN